MCCFIDRMCHLAVKSRTKEFRRLESRIIYFLMSESLADTKSVNRSNISPKNRRHKQCTLDILRKIMGQRGKEREREGEKDTETQRLKEIERRRY